MSILDNIDTSTFSFGSGGNTGGYNFPGTFDGAFSNGWDSASTFISDGWDSSLGFLSDGLNVYKDYLQVSQKGPYEIPAAMSLDQWSEQQQNADTQAQNGSGGGQIIPGVGNGVILLAGAALAVVLLTK